MMGPLATADRQAAFLALSAEPPQAAECVLKSEAVSTGTSGFFVSPSLHETTDRTAIERLTSTMGPGLTLSEYRKTEELADLLQIDGHYHALSVFARETSLLAESSWFVQADIFLSNTASSRNPTAQALGRLFLHSGSGQQAQVGSVPIWRPYVIPRSLDQSGRYPAPLSWLGGL